MDEASIKDENKLIAEFMGYIYYHPGVDIEEEYGYNRKEVFSKVPILIEEFPEEDQYYFKDLPNPDYKNTNTIQWRDDFETLGWNTLNYGEYITDLKYDTSWDWLITVVEKIESIKDEYHGHFGVYISSNNCTIQATNFRPDKRIPDPPHYFANYTLNSKIESTYQAAVEFIKWHNSVKQ